MSKVKTKDRKYWRLFYTVQELLSVDRAYMETVSNSDDGGIRMESTLPPRLRRLAHKITEEELECTDQDLEYVEVLAYIKLRGSRRFKAVKKEITDAKY